FEMPPSSTMDPYAVLELQRGCSEGDIQKAYKKQCLKWHPDKNRDNEEEASKRFILAKEAFELLFDKTARSEYDRKKESERVRDEKQRERMQKADGERKRFMEDLERREKEFADRNKKPQDGGSRPKTAVEKRREEERARESFEEIRRRLEREVNEEVKEQQEVFRRVRDERAAAAAAAVKPCPLLKVEWRGGDYDEKRLRHLFTPYGKIHAVTGTIVKSKGKGKMCLVEFESGESAWGAELESGKEGEKFKATWEVEPEKIETRREVEKKEEKDEETNGGGGGDASNGANLHEMSYEELMASLIEPPMKKVKGPNENPSWKEDI
ncbi:hypothetical protein PENTCL1PPCAC_22521, partial [Pristionchus entomophagus]